MGGGPLLSLHITNNVRNEYWLNIEEETWRIYWREFLYLEYSEKNTACPNNISLLSETCHPVKYSNNYS